MAAKKVTRKPKGVGDDILKAVASATAKRANKAYSKAEKSLAPKAMGKANKLSKRSDMLMRKADVMAAKKASKKRGK